MGHKCVYIDAFGEPFSSILEVSYCGIIMGEIKHLVLAKFKEDAKVDEILKGLEKLVSEIDLVKSFEWGEDIESHEMLRQGFTHAFLMTFNTKDDLNAYNSHPKHVEFSAVFSTVIEKVVLLDFPSVSIKAPAT